MTPSSPDARRTKQLASPERGLILKFLDHERRNSELSHQDALVAAQAEHERVREAALRVYSLHNLEEQRRRIAEAERLEHERLAAEELVVAEELRLRELKLKSIPRPPPAPPTPVQEEPPKLNEPEKKQEVTPKPIAQAAQSTTPQLVVNTPTQLSQTSHAGFSKTPPRASVNLFANGVSKVAEVKKETLAPQTNGFSATRPVITPAFAPTQQASPPVQVANVTQTANQRLVNRYSEIHQELKKLRKNLILESKVAGSPMKGKLGTARREIRVAIGQLTGVKGANAQPTSKIVATLREALEGQIPSPPVDVSLYVISNRQPVEGAKNNDSTMPALFIYLVNICAKGIIAQFINEASANPKAADPIGVFCAHIFSNQDFHWRGESLIDILMAKFRFVCPVVFGLRGNDKTQGGRAKLGWKKDGASYITEQSHNDRMTGLGAGFASIALRDFSKTSRTNPYPPTNYWKALATIVNTPAGETSNTQYVVLRSMIESYEQRFLNFYGNAAFAALQMALIEFPKKAPQDATAAGSLRALVDVLRGDGLILT